MSFKFSLLNLSSSRCKCNSKLKMAKKNKLKAHRKKFGKASKKCHKKSKSKSDFGKCMRKEFLRG